ncbi:hypothetical protein B0H12DRAFT_1170595, partial [Mycena haematopus]
MFGHLCQKIPNPQSRPRRFSAISRLPGFVFAASGNYSYLLVILAPVSSWSSFA